MKKIALLITGIGIAFGLNAQIASVAKPHLDVQGPLYLRQNLYTLNKAETDWIIWGTRDVSTTQTTINLSNINNVLIKGKVGIGTSLPKSVFHIRSNSIDNLSTSRFDANMIIEATNTSRTIGIGAALGFVVPANTDGSNSWQQGRILVTPDNTGNTNACGRMYLQTRYLESGAWKWRNNLVLRSSGRVGIGTTNPQSELAVNGTITSKEVVVTTDGWSDFVFKENYKLRKLEEVESFIEENNHLPDIPSEKEVLENGIQVGEMNAKFLQKIEELTLYMIEQNKETKTMKAQLDKLAKENEELKVKITKLETVE